MERKFKQNQVVVTTGRIFSACSGIDWPTNKPVKVLAHDPYDNTYLCKDNKGNAYWLKEDQMDIVSPKEVKEYKS